MLESEIQSLIATFPWILNLNYESIPELKKRGQESSLRNSTRIDLVLKDKISGRPVFVEFKSVPFYRENIGQILEYRARAAIDANEENSLLSKIFGNRLDRVNSFL